MSRSAIVLASLLVSAVPAGAVPVDIGTPLVVAESGLSGSTLNFFFDGRPGVNLIDVRGTVDAEFGLDGFVGTELRFTTGILDDGGTGPVFEALTLTFGNRIFTNIGVDGPVPTPLYPVSGGLLTPEDDIAGFEFLIEPPFTEIETPAGSGDYTLTYDGQFAPFGPLTSNDPGYPAIRVGLNVHLSGPRPMREFVDPDCTGAEDACTVSYVEGPLTITRLELGLVNGAPLPEPPAAVPLPAALPLMALALGGLGRRPRRPPA